MCTYVTYTCTTIHTPAFEEVCVMITSMAESESGSENGRERETGAGCCCCSAVKGTNTVARDATSITLHIANYNRILV